MPNLLRSVIIASGIVILFFFFFNKSISLISTTEERKEMSGRYFKVWGKVQNVMFRQVRIL